MTTKITQQPNRYSPAEQLVFIKYSTAKKGQHIETVMGKENGRRKILARIFPEYDPIEKKMKYKAKDREGKEIFPEAISLYELERKFIERAKQLAQEVQSPEKNEPVLPVRLPEKPQEKGEKKSIGKKIKDKAQEFTQSLVPAREAESLDPISDSVTEQALREGEIKNLREKNNGKEKNKELNR
jgi:hypothetical protein